MTANEVNDIVLRLMAAADHIRGREREEILHHVGRLSRAAVRERTAAVDEMQRLRKKIVQQSAELKRIENASGMPAAPVTQASKPSQPPTGGGFARFTESRLQALNSGSAPALDYGPDYGRLSRPGDLPQPDRRAAAAAADSGPVLSRGEQQFASKGAPATSSSQSRDSVIQEQPGFGQFNQARFLALQAGPLVTTSSDGADGRSSSPGGPAQPAYMVMAANAEPVAPRGKRQNEILEGPSSTMQAVDQLLDEIKFSQPVFAGQKRRVSDGDPTPSAASKKQLMTVATNTATDAMQPVATGSQAVPGNMASLSQTQSAMDDAQSAINHAAALRSGRPTCTHCFQHRVPNCDGRAHCNQGGSHKCYYVRCDPETCLGAACVKIHPSQYDLQARKSGQVRRLVIGDPGSLPEGHWDKHAHGKAVAAMGRATGMNQHPLAGLPVSTQGIYHMPQGHVKGSGSASRHAINKPKKVHKTAANPALKSEPTHSGPIFDARGIKLGSSDD